MVPCSCGRYCAANQIASHTHTGLLLAGGDVGVHIDSSGTPLFLTRAAPHIGWKREDAGAEECDNNASIKAFRAAVDLGAGRTYTAVLIPAESRRAHACISPSLTSCLCGSTIAC